MASAAGSKGASSLSCQYKQRIKGLRRKNRQTLSAALDKISSNERVYKDEKFITAEENNCLENNR